MKETTLFNDALKSDFSAHTAEKILIVLFAVLLLIGQTTQDLTEFFFDGLHTPIAHNRNTIFGIPKISWKNTENFSIEKTTEYPFYLEVSDPFFQNSKINEGLILFQDIIKETTAQIRKTNLCLPDLSVKEAENQTHPDDIHENILEEWALPGQIVSAATVSDLTLPDTTKWNICVSETLSKETILPERKILDAIEELPTVPEVLPDENKFPNITTPNITEKNYSMPRDLPDKDILPDLPPSPPDTPSEDVSVPNIDILEPEVQDPILEDPIEMETTLPEERTDQDSSVTPVIPDTEQTDVSEIDTTQEEEEKPLSCFLLDEAGMLYGFLPEYADLESGCLELPEECTGVRSGTFTECGAGIQELYIPANTTLIEEGAFSGLNELEWIEVDSENPAYISLEGVLFDHTMSVLLAFPNGRTFFYLFPPSVTQIANSAFANTSITRLDLRICGMILFGESIFGDSDGEGITVLVPAGTMAEYQELLAGYNVTIRE